MSSTKPKIVINKSKKTQKKKKLKIRHINSVKKTKKDNKNMNKSIIEDVQRLINVYKKTFKMGKRDPVLWPPILIGSNKKTFSKYILTNTDLEQVREGNTILAVKPPLYNKVIKLTKKTKIVKSEFGSNSGFRFPGSLPTKDGHICSGKYCEKWLKIDSDFTSHLSDFIKAQKIKEGIANNANNANNGNNVNNAKVTKKKVKSTKLTKDIEKLIKKLYDLTDKRINQYIHSDLKGSKLPEKFLLKMGDVYDVKKKGKKMFVIPSQSYDEVVLFDQDDFMFDDSVSKDYGYFIGKGGKEGDKDYHKKIACDGDNCWLWIKVIPGLDKFFEKIIALEENNS